jgi:leader peptidase (prepilin peptidase)/N-methyltransferase
MILVVAMVAGGLGVALDPLWRGLAAGLAAGRWLATPVDPSVVLGIVTGALAAALVATAGPGAAALAPVVVVASAIDLRLHRLPDRLTMTATAALAATIAVVAVSTADASLAARATAGGALFAGLLLVVHLVSPRGMGFGDVKLGVPLGLAVGATGVMNVVVALTLASVIGAVAGLVVLARHRDRARAFAFGPCLCAGAVLAVFVA